MSRVLMWRRWWRGLSAPGAKAQKEGFGTGSSLNHRYGNGDGEIRLETFSGDAEIVME